MFLINGPVPSFSRGRKRNLFDFTSFTFTNAGAEGTFGPTLAQCQTAYAGQNFINGYFSVATQGFQFFTVPVTGTYRITTAGAQGGSGKWNIHRGGLGAVLRADFSLTEGSLLIFVVGQRGGYVESVSNGSGGGGGGSFVFANSVSSNNLLIAAGGGSGGGGNSSAQNGQNGLTTTSGSSSSPAGFSGGSSGNGGAAGTGGGGGGGIQTNGANGTDTAAGGSSILTTAAGGRGGQCAASVAGTKNFNNLGQDQGGFGGGGGGEWCSAGSVGGGGGYSGGAGNSSSSGVGGGGGSFFSVSATNRASSDGLYNGSGIVNLGIYNGSLSLSQWAALAGYVTLQIM
jgi:hypothetical protein